MFGRMEERQHSLTTNPFCTSVKYQQTLKQLRGLKEEIVLI